MNLAQLIDATSASEGLLRAPRQFGKPLGVRSHILDKTADQPPPHLMAQPETQEEARRVMASTAIARAKERADELHAKRQRAQVARQARLDARAKKRAEKNAARQARMQAKGELKKPPRRGRGAHSVTREVLEQVLRDGPLMLPSLCAAFDAEIKDRGLKRVGWYTIKDLLRRMREQGVIVVHGTKRKYRYGLRGRAG